MTGIVDELERRLLPRLEEAAAALRVQHPQIKITTWSSPVGSLTEYQGHDVGIDCLCAEASADEGDNVALSVGVKHLTTIPKLCEAAVCWGAGGPASGLDLLPEPVPWSDQALRFIEERLPDLVQSLSEELRRLESAVRRGGA